MVTVKEKMKMPRLDDCMTERMGLPQLRAIHERIGVSEKTQLVYGTAIVELFLSAPVPLWLKHSDMRMGRVNKFYANHFGIDIEDYEGATDFEFWGDFGSKFLVHDQQVLEEKIDIKFEMIGPNPKTNKLETWTVRKWPVVFNGSVDFIAGIILEIKEHG